MSKQSREAIMALIDFAHTYIVAEAERLSPCYYFLPGEREALVDAIRELTNDSDYGTANEEAA